MATLNDLVEAGQLHRWDAGAELQELPERVIYGTSEFVRWLNQDLQNIVSGSIGADLSPAEQLFNLFVTFVSGRPIRLNRQFRHLRPLEKNVWELKTLDLRIVGWFAALDTFVAARGITANTVKDSKLYYGLSQEVEWFRHSIDCPFVAGGRPEDVISNPGFQQTTKRGPVHRRCP